MEGNFSTDQFDMIDEKVKAFIDSFSATAPFSCTPLAGGANNRVYHVVYPDRDPVVLKCYFQHPQDRRPRLLAEYEFLQYAWKIGLRCIPQPLAIDRQANAAIYSYLPGRPVESSEISELLIQQAVEFFHALNRCKQDGAALSTVSEACFSIQEHVSLIEKRVQSLLGFEGQELMEFAQNHLIPSWEKIKNGINRIPDHLLVTEERCISPADFGFHNTVLQDGRLAFFDFEYAGWDDPAKTICDFFYHTRVLVPFRFFPYVSEQFVSVCARPQEALERARALFPAYGIKWCCIILNIFSPMGKTRRTFACIEEQKEGQLKMAKRLLNQINEVQWLT